MNTLVRTVDKIFQIVNRTSCWLDIMLRHAMAALMCTLFILLISQVSFRYFIRFPLSWIEEFATFAFSYLALIGLAVCFRAGSHVSMNTLFVKFGPKLQSVFSVFFCVIAIYFATLMIWSGHTLVILGRNELTYSGTFTLLWPRLALIVGGVLLILNAAVIVLANIAYWLTGEIRTVACGKMGNSDV